MIEVFVAFIFICWLILTLISQFKCEATDRLRRLDFFAILPLWTFFSPNPLTKDLDVFYRTINDEGDIGPWQPLLSRATEYKGMIWKFKVRRARKAILDFGLQFIEEMQHYPQQEIATISLPYIAFLFESAEIANLANTKNVQFCLLSNPGTHMEIVSKENKSSLILISDIHQV